MYQFVSRGLCLAGDPAAIQPGLPPRGLSVRQHPGDRQVRVASVHNQQRPRTGRYAHVQSNVPLTLFCDIPSNASHHRSQAVHTDMIVF